MFGSQVLEVAIGLVLLYLLLSLLCSSIREGLEAWQKTRASDLERGIRELLQDREGTGLAKAVYEHPLVYGLYKGEYEPAKTLKNLPSYIPSRNFAVALMDIVARGPSTPLTATGAQPVASPTSTAISLDTLRASVANVRNAPVQRTLLTAIDTAQGNLGRAQANVEAWFDSSMDRVSGWYKRRTQTIIFVVGALLTAAVNADTLTIAESLVQDDALRKAVVAEAEAIARDKELRTTDVERRYHDLSTMGFPIGWARELPALSDKCDYRCVALSATRRVPTHLLGWLLTAFAISLGAPFWFDVLNKFVVIRSTIKPHEKSPEEPSEDRQTRPAPQTVGAQFQRHEWAQGDPREGVI